MRKLIVSLNTTLDGFIAGSRGELDWHFQYWSESMGEALCDLLSGVDTILLGRKTYDSMVGHWPGRDMDPQCRGIEFMVANKMNTVEKVVFSHSQPDHHWNNTRIATTPSAKEIKRLKNAAGNNLLVLGSGQLVSFLTREDLVDEYQLWVHPLLLGRGKLFSSCVGTRQALTLKKISRFETGVLRMIYGAPKQNAEE